MAGPGLGSAQRNAASRSRLAVSPDVGTEPLGDRPFVARLHRQGLMQREGNGYPTNAYKTSQRGEQNATTTEIKYPASQQRQSNTLTSRIKLTVSRRPAQARAFRAHKK